MSEAAERLKSMSYDQEPVSPMFRIDVSPEAESSQPLSGERMMVELMRQLIAGQQQQNRLIEDLIQQNLAANKQRASELQQWKEANPDLAKSCHRAAEALSRVQTQFLDTLTEEIEDTEDHLVEGEYMLNEFVDRFGPRLAHLNGVLQVLAQLGDAETGS
jgi:putative heme iron utilization protein